jgi:hypothetical protein
VARFYLRLRRYRTTCSRHPRTPRQPDGRAERSRTNASMPSRTRGRPNSKLSRARCRV